MRYFLLGILGGLIVVAGLCLWVASLSGADLGQSGASEATLLEQTKHLEPGDFIRWKDGHVSAVTELKGGHIVTREFNGQPRHFSADRIVGLAHNIIHYQGGTYGAYALTAREFLGVGK